MIKKIISILIIALCFIVNNSFGAAVDITALPDMGTPAEVTDSLLSYDSSAASGSRLTEIKFSADPDQCLNGEGEFLSPTALGTLGTKATPIDADKVVMRDSADSDAVVTSTWTQIKAFLKTYFDTLYGDIVGPASATDEAGACFDGVTGKLLKECAGGIINLNKGTTLPVTCNQGDTFQKTDGTTAYQTYLCESTDSWVAIGSGVEIGLAASDETTDLTTGTAKVTFRAPYAFTLTGVRLNLATTATGATLLTVDINASGTTVLSTKLTIDASEKTSTTASTPAVISDSAIADDAEITIDIDAVGNTTTGKGLKIWLIGTRGL